MDGRWHSGTSDDLGNDPAFHVTSPSDQDQYEDILFSAPAMDRSNLSGSSIQSNRSIGSYQDQNYVESPLTLYDSPQSEFSPPSQLNLLSLETARPSQERNGEPFLFDLETHGDPRINRRFYYDFKVTKTEAYLELQPHYLPTKKFPARIVSEKIAPNGEKLHRCLHLNCTANPFTRHYDLERHFKIHQGDGNQVFCDYKRCPHKEPFRKDHCREHYREYHAEDLVKRVSPKSTKPKEGLKQPESLEEFMAARMGNLDLSWWRCPKCIIRVQVDDLYTCPECHQACEPVRVAWRERANKIARGEIVSDCGQCENSWVADDSSLGVWAPCPRCCKDGL